MALPAVDAAIRKFALSAAGNFAEKYLLKYFLKRYKPDTNFSQSGQAGAVPPPDTAPLTGGAHEDESIEDVQNPTLKYVNDRTATNFHQTSSGSLADEVDYDMRYKNSTNGTSFNNKERDVEK